jgi:DNA modification methylase
MKPYYKNDLTTIYNGDCLEVMDYLIEQGVKVDLIITSPPYNLGLKDRNCGGVLIKYNEYDDKLSYKNYIDWQVNVLNKAYELLSDKGMLYYNHKERHISGYYFSPLEILFKSKFNILQTIIWNRKSGYTFNIGRFVNSYETINVCYKTDKYMRINKDYEKNFDVWNMTPKSDKDHPAPFPKELATRIIESYDKEENMIVLDMFGGSFTTCIASEQLNRRSIGIELDKKYCDVGVKRLSQLQMRLEI